VTVADLAADPEDLAEEPQTRAIRTWAARIGEAAGGTFGRRRSPDEGSPETERTMERAVIVKGRVVDSRHIELDEPVDEIAGDVEVTVRSLDRAREQTPTDVAALERVEEEWRAKHPDRLRSKEDIDRDVAEERASWGDGEG
jgi:hypothetical protein